MVCMLTNQGRCKHAIDCPECLNSPDYVGPQRERDEDPETPHYECETCSDDGWVIKADCRWQNINGQETDICAPCAYAFWKSLGVGAHVPDGDAYEIEFFTTAFGHQRERYATREAAIARAKRLAGTRRTSVRVNSKGGHAMDAETWRWSPDWNRAVPFANND